MLSILSIYFFALLVCLLSGIAFRLVVDFRGRWVSHWCLPLGAATAILVLYPLGYAVPMRAGAYIYCGLLVGVLCVGFGLRHRAARHGRANGLVAALSPERSDVQILVIGLAGGLLLLIPFFSLGFPSTMAIGIYDGWARAVGIDLLREHTISYKPPDSATSLPLAGYSSFSASLGAGFEYLGALVSTVLGKQGVDVVNTLAAIGVPIAVSGWSRLWTVIGGDRRPSGLQAALIAIAVASPLFVLPFTDDYITQFFSLAQWPFAVAAALCFFGSMSVARLLIAAVAIAGVMGTYPPLLPWLVPVVVVGALFAGGAGELPLVRRLSVSDTVRPWIGRAALLAVLAACVLVLAPVELSHAYHSVVAVGGSLTANAAFPLWGLKYDVLLLAGARSQYQLPPFAHSLEAWPTVLLALLAAVAAVIGLAALVSSPQRVSRRLLAVGGVILIVTLVSFVKYRYGDSYGYGSYKAIVSGGTLLAGLLVVTLAGRTKRTLWPAQLVAVGALALAWVPTSVSLLQLQTTGRANLGFRDEDRQLADEIKSLPPSSEVLVEGAAETPDALRLRMTTAYYAAALDRPLEGLGTTHRYGATGGGQVWVPTRPWSYVVSSTEPLPFGQNRALIWHNGLYRVSRAPAIDVTPYDLLSAPCGSDRSSVTNTPRQTPNWLPGGIDSDGPFEPLAGSADLVVSNRSQRPASARLTMDVSSYGVAHRVALSTSGSRTTAAHVAPGPPRRIALDVPIEPSATRIVHLRVRPDCEPPPAPQTPIISVRNVKVSREAP